MAADPPSTPPPIPPPPQFWFRRGPVWWLVNALIGLVFGMGIAFCWGVIVYNTGLIEVGKDQGGEPGATAALLMTLVTGVGGWLAFCYWPDPRYRARVLGLAYTGGVVLACVASIIDTVFKPWD